MRIPLWNRSVWALFLCTFFSIFAQFTNHSFRYLHFRSYFGVMCLFIAANSVSVFSFCPVVLRLQVQSWDTTRFTLREFFKFLSDYLFWNYMSCVYSAWYHLESEVFSFWVIVFYFFTSFFLHFCCPLLLSNLVLLFSTSAYVLYLLLVFSLFSSMVSRTLFYDCWQCPLTLLLNVVCAEMLWVVCWVCTYWLA